jgi:hypothetical protein
MKWVLAVLIVLAAHSAAGWREHPPAFPLRIAEAGTHLEDASGHPFLVNGDTAWSLIAELRREEVESYLADRRQRGFNALLVNLVEHQFSSHAPANAYGERPFAGALAFSGMNERYFAHAAWILERAEEEGFLVFLVPAYLGANGSDQGWYQKMVEAGTDVLQDYGTYIARRFSERRNIIWVHGGDFDAPEKELVQAVATGIERTAPNALHTVHSRRDTATAEYWAGERWLALDTVYTYDETYPAVLAQTAGRQAMPVVMIEGLYEGEHGTDEEMIRRQAYGAMLAGASGHLFGNNPIWHFSSRGLYETELDWTEALGSRGAESMTHFRELFESIPWWLISPGAPGHGIVAEGATGGPFYAASASDGSFSLVYLSGEAALSFRPEEGDGRYRIQWFDPAGGMWHESSILTLETGTTAFSPPAVVNAAGYRDWVALIRSAD